MPKIFDTLTSSHLLNESLKENGLKYLTRTQLHREVVEYKDAIKYGTDSPEFAKYATEDAINTYSLYKLQSPQIEKQGLHHLAYDIEFPFQKALMHLAINGIAADVSAAQAMRYEVQHLFYEIENELLEIFGGKYVTSITPRSRVTSCTPSINFNSSDQVIPLIEKLGFKIYEKSKTGKKSWAKQAKKRLEGKHPTIDLLIKLGKIEKLLNGFLVPFETFVEADGRIRPSFHNTVCVTGRLSCTSPNIEQLPNQNDIANIRNLFIAEPGNVIIIADYKGQELRIMAVDSNDKVMLSELCKGFDIHLSTANDFNNLNLSTLELTDKTPEHKVAKKKYKNQRDDCKCIGFGIPYGKGAYGFAKDFNCSEKEAQITIDKFFTKYPAIRRAIEKTKGQVYKHGFVRNMSGRKRRFPDFHKLNKWGKERCYRQSYNFKIQSFGADMIKAAAAKIVEDTKIKLINIVHDELVFEVPKEYVKIATAFIKHCMITAVKLSIPLEVDIGYGERYGESKS